MEESLSLPVCMTHDSMRLGLPSSVNKLEAAHPVEQIQHSEEKMRAKRLLEIKRQFGLGAAIRRNAQELRLSRFHRLPGLESSFAGLDSFTGKDTKLEYQDWLGDGELSSQLCADFHSTMEAKLKM